jgi:seryl-tRNA synthetase
MLDPNFLRENADKVRAYVTSGRGRAEKVDIDKWLELDKQRTSLIIKKDDLNRKKNELAKLGQEGKIEEVRELGRQIKEETSKVEEEYNKVTKEWQEILDWLPNVPLADVPYGTSADDNVEIKAWIPGTGYVDPKFLDGAEGSANAMPNVGSNANEEFQPRPHWEIGQELNLIDLDAGSRTSGSRFYYLKNEAYLLIEGIFYILTKRLLEEGFSPMVVPLLVREEALYAVGQFPEEKDQVYAIKTDNIENANQLYLIGSSESSNFNYYRDAILDEAELPEKIMAKTTCFRSEAGSWGKDVRGIKRTHQFEKLEMNMIIKNDLDAALAAHEYLLSINEWLLQQLEIPYHVINMCLGDLGYNAAAKKYDVEVWLPSTGEFMEVMSDSITTDYQTRRFNIRYRDENRQLQYAYTLNDTGATHRLLIAILDHYQQKDGSVKVPKVLQEYVGKEVIKRG